MFNISSEVLVIVYVRPLLGKLSRPSRTEKHTGRHCNVAPPSMRNVLLEQIIEISPDFAGLDAGKVDRMRTDKDMSFILLIV